MPVFCALDRIRTYDLLLRRQTLYPLSYEGSQGSCRYRRDVLELSRKVAPKGKSARSPGPPVMPDAKFRHTAGHR